jgi:hypothetical protein
MNIEWRGRELNVVISSDGKKMTLTGPKVTYSVKKYETGEAFPNRRDSSEEALPANLPFAFEK